MTGRPDLPKIRSVRARPGYRLEIVWEHDETSTIDMRDIVSYGGVFDALRDTDFFATVRLGDRGRYIEWRDPLNKERVLADYDADSLIRLADRQRTSLGLDRVVKALRNLIAHGAKDPAA